MVLTVIEDAAEFHLTAAEVVEVAGLCSKLDGLKEEVTAVGRRCVGQG